MILHQDITLNNITRNGKSHRRSETFAQRHSFSDIAGGNLTDYVERDNGLDCTFLQKIHIWRDKRFVVNRICNLVVSRTETFFSNV